MNEEEMKSRVNKLTCGMTEEETNKLYQKIIEYINEPIIEYINCEINVNDPFDNSRAFRKIPDYNELIKDNSKKQQEIEKLNNIINELNYGIKELYDMFYETFRISQNSYYSISEWELKEFTDKLQKLKEEGNNNE